MQLLIYRTIAITVIWLLKMVRIVFGFEEEDEDCEEEDCDCEDCEEEE